MKIRSLTLKNIGVFEDETIHFPEKKVEGAEIHILTGQNGTGKTTILQTLAVGLLRKKPFEDIRPLIKATKLLENYLKRLKHDNCGEYHGNVKFSDESLIDFKDVKITIEGATIINDVKLHDIIKEKQEEVRELTKKQYTNLYEYSFVALSYSGYRFINNEDNISLSDDVKYSPIENALDFVKDYEKNGYSLNKWLAQTISKRANAREQGDDKGIERFSKAIRYIEEIIEEIVGEKNRIKFELLYSHSFKVIANIDGKKIDFDLLPDGLRSIISWLGDLIMRMDALKWENDLDIFEREFILFLDEIEVHLHPYWQRKILPVIQKKFKNAQIFITTHSPFIVNSVDGAWIYELKLDEKGNCHCEEPQISSTAMPIDEVLEEIYDIETTQMYGQSIEKEIEEFRTELEKAYERNNTFDKPTFLKKAKRLAQKSVELRNNVQFELRQLSKNLDEEFSL